VVRAGAYLEPEDPAGDTPVYVATARKFLDLAICLIENGASLRHKNKAGNLVMVLACQEGAIDIVRAMLNADKQQPPIVDLPQWRNGVNPLISAVFNKRRGVVHLLLAYRADPTVVDHQGHSALHVAAQQRDVSLIKELRAAQEQLQQQAGTGASDRGGVIFRAVEDAISLLGDQPGADAAIKLLSKILRNLVEHPEVVSCNPCLFECNTLHI
jgi:ankyrin repeat protein